MQDINLIIAACILLAVSSCSGLGIFSHLDVYKEAYVRHVSGRVRRDTGNVQPLFPEKATFAIETIEGVFILRIKHAHRKGPKGLMYISTDQGIKKYVPPTQPMYEFYVGENVPASIVMNCEGNIRPCTIFGEYFIGNDVYLIDTNTTTLHAHKKMKYTIHKPIEEEGDFYHDTVSDDPRQVHHQAVKPNTFGKGILKPGGDHVTETRFKREAKQFTVESVFMIDQLIQAHFNDLANGVQAEAMALMDQYYNYIAVGISQRFASFTEHSYEFYPIIYLLSQANEDILFVKYTYGGVLGLDAGDTITQLGDVMEYNPDFFGGADHFMLITKYPMGSGQAFNTLGIAYYSDSFLRVCNRAYKNVAVTRDFAQGRTTHIAAHEFGHNFGIAHDPTEDSICDDYYIMYPAVSTYNTAQDATNPYMLSSCSLAQLSASTTGFISSYGDTSCLETFSYTNEAAMDDIFADDYLGQVMSLEEQCELYYGQSSSSSLDGALEDVCYKGHFCGSRRTIAMTGTSCATNKWCYNGECVAITDATTTETTTTEPTTTEPTTTEPTTTEPTTTEPTTTEPTTSTETTTTETTTETTTSETTTPALTTTTTQATRGNGRGNGRGGKKKKKNRDGK